MIYLLTYAAGLFTRSMVDRYMDKRRFERVQAWRHIAAGRVRLPLAEELKMRGAYDHPLET